MKGWKDERMEGWKHERMEGRMEGRKDGAGGKPLGNNALKCERFKLIGEGKGAIGDSFARSYFSSSALEPFSRATASFPSSRHASDELLRMHRRQLSVLPKH